MPETLMQDVICSKCGVPIRDSFCGLRCDGRADGVSVEYQQRRAERQCCEEMARQRDELLGALKACDTAFASWQLGQIPGRPEDILALIVRVRAAIATSCGEDPS